MTALIALAGPILAAAVAATLRRRFGPWASWLLLLSIAFLTVHFLGSTELWRFSGWLWDIHQGWGFSGWFWDLDQAIAILGGATVAALLLHQFSRTRPTLSVQIAAAGIAGLAVPWLFATLKPGEEWWDAFLVLCGLWLLGLLVRDGRRWWKRRSSSAHST